MRRRRSKYSRRERKHFLITLTELLEINTVSPLICCLSFVLLLLLLSSRLQIFSPASVYPLLPSSLFSCNKQLQQEQQQFWCVSLLLLLLLVKGREKCFIYDFFGELLYFVFLFLPLVLKASWRTETDMLNSHYKRRQYTMSSIHFFTWEAIAWQQQIHPGLPFISCSSWFQDFVFLLLLYNQMERKGKNKKKNFILLSLSSQSLQDAKKNDKERYFQLIQQTNNAENETSKE